VRILSNLTDTVRRPMAAEFDLLLLDMRLPGMNGPTTLSLLQDVAPRARVILPGEPGVLVPLASAFAPALRTEVVDEGRGRVAA